MPGRTYLIGIAGPSGAGKSFLAENLARELNASVLAIDSYYRDLRHIALGQRAQSNFDDPAAIEDALLIQDLSAIGRGEPVDIPVYDFATHTRRAEKQRFDPAPVVIVEGLFTLHWPKIRELLGTKVYVDLEDGLCFQRRMERDIRERGRTPESVLEQYRMTVVPMGERYVSPTMGYADVVVSGDAPIEYGVQRVIEHFRRQVHTGVAHEREAH